MQHCGGFSIGEITGGLKSEDPCREHPPGDPERPVYCDVPCTTGNSILDDPTIQLGFEGMWEDSHYGSDSDPNPESQRREQVAFLVPGASGNYILQRLASHLIVESGPCRNRFKKPNNLPEGTIFVHTHPYSAGDEQNHCIPGKTLIYDNEVGVEDRPTLDSMGLDLGIILDADKIIMFTTDESEEPILIDRCGY